jgi:hypothetical protein
MAGERGAVRPAVSRRVDVPAVDRARQSPNKKATRGTPTAALTPVALINQPIALPRPVGGKTSAINAR